MIMSLGLALAEERERGRMSSATCPPPQDPWRPRGRGGKPTEKGGGAAALPHAAEGGGGGGSVPSGKLSSPMVLALEAPMEAREPPPKEAEAEEEALQSHPSPPSPPAPPPKRRRTRTLCRELFFSASSTVVEGRG